MDGKRLLIESDLCVVSFPFQEPSNLFLPLIQRMYSPEDDPTINNHFSFLFFFFFFFP